MSTSRTYTVGAVLTAAQQNDLAQGTLGYAQVTANQGSITTVVDLTSLTVTATLVAGRRIRITGQCLFQSTVADDTVELRIMEGGTQLTQIDVIARVASITATAHGSVILTPTAASHTYKLSALRASGTGTVTMTAGATFPAYILVEDIGV